MQSTTETQEQICSKTVRALSYQHLKNSDSKDYYLKEAPERVIQFGAGNFLRSFADAFFDIANEKSGFHGKVVVVTRSRGAVSEKLESQDCLYTLYLRGMVNGKKVENRRLISAISRVLDAETQFEKILECAANPDIRFILSNTTEAGIVFDGRDRFDDPAHASYPARLTRFLFRRYEACGREHAGGFVLLPCELIEDNGKNLKKCILEYCRLWNLEKGFQNWVEEKNEFCSTLVDRIVPGYPAEDAGRYTAENAYADQLLTAAEPFGFWAIEGDARLNEVLPFMKANLPVIVTPDIAFFKKRKVWVLNGGHTAMTTAALLSGCTTVAECMADPDISAFLRKAVYNEIIPAAPLPADELREFADSVMDRFRNPFIRHRLISISLNTVSKWKTRVLPSLHHYVEKNGKLPQALVFGFACNLLFELCGRFEVQDEPEVLRFFAAYKDQPAEETVPAYAGNADFWGEDLNQLEGFTRLVLQDIRSINALGAREALKKVLAYE